MSITATLESISSKQETAKFKYTLTKTEQNARNKSAANPKFSWKEHQLLSEVQPTNISQASYKKMSRSTWYHKRNPNQALSY